MRSIFKAKHRLCDITTHADEHNKKEGEKNNHT